VSDIETRDRAVIGDFSVTTKLDETLEMKKGKYSQAVIELNNLGWSTVEAYFIVTPGTLHDLVS
jgi:hypothetical protein